MSDTPEGNPRTEHDCPEAAALRSADWKGCLYGPPETAELAARSTGMQYWSLQPAPPLREEAASG